MFSIWLIFQFSIQVDNFDGIMFKKIIFMEFYRFRPTPVLFYLSKSVKKVYHKKYLLVVWINGSINDLHLNFFYYESYIYFIKQNGIDFPSHISVLHWNMLNNDPLFRSIFHDANHFLFQIHVANQDMIPNL